MNRVYHPYVVWEDHREGMYQKECFMDEQQMIADCEATLACPQWLEEGMKFVSYNWANAAEHNLTNTHRNRQAWLGQAACCFYHGAPEYITKLAWNNLTDQQRAAANTVADHIIRHWETQYENKRLPWQSNT